MTEEYWPLQGSAATEARVRKLFRHFAGDSDPGSGVVAGVANELAVTAGGAQSVDLDTGEAIVDGMYYSNDAVKNLTFSDAHASDDRIDTVVLRLTPSAGDDDGDITAVIVEGTAGADPDPPALTQDEDGVYEYPLFDYTVAAGAGVPSNFVDRRDLITPTPPADASEPEATGDLWFRNAAGLMVPLPVGTADQVLHGGATPQWNSGSSVTAVEHGADNTAARPTGFDLVIWVGTVEPDNPTTDDVLLRTDQNLWYRYDGAAWQQIGGGDDRAVLTGFNRADLGTSQTNLQLDTPVAAAGIGDAQIPVVADRPGSIVGLSIAGSGARTGGTATFEVFVNGTGTGLTVVIDGTNPQYHSNSQAASTDTISAGDRIDVRVTTDASWTPETNDWIAAVTVQYD